ncbi:LysR family transcriptional regulator [Raoultella ornithinolytica]|uniref:LysR family transcriptional regulator n=1 Tax=Raoultella ornithinolytica TaxID=54291 RepID=UPI000BFF1C10|nr:LysR family transcriptional regulator [Raoultella ornithinolytica]ATM23643.1 transcriptional regulator [Raoultella ornithinolytica]ELK6034087.1 LysR family transcriptional regulator [Raoultella ornithinolytica]ELM7289235.1 LysR family transcriptional regulator [Raoultella ornithinolytica]ELO0974811.1 LysR family transcriptional regulator [Raoultella ornithinolytica]WKL83917.1 LysR family transcriptional regulator [Raoultella ornithinolytica]
MKSDIRNLDLNLLKALDALLDERSVTRAATRLSLTQPAVSGMLTRLREAFNDPLFIRAPHGMVPTLRAQALASPVKQLLADAEALLYPATFDPLQADFTWTMAATDYALKAAIVPFIAALKTRAPCIRVRVIPDSPQMLFAQTERGDVDIALLTPHSTPPDLHSRTLYQEEYVCLMRADHPLAAAPLTLDLFCSLEHVLVSWQGDSFRGVTDEALAALGRSRRVGLSVSSFLVLPEILAISDMIAVVPRRLAKMADGMRIAPPPLTIPGFSKSMAWHERSHRDPAQQWLRELLFRTNQQK